jgi:hypothetical protein
MARKHKKSKSPLEVLAMVRTTPVTITPQTEPFRKESGLAKFTREEAAREKDAQDAVMRPALQENAKLLRQLMESDSVTLYIQPSKYLATLAPGAEDGSKWNGVSPDQIRGAIQTAYTAFEKSIAAEGRVAESGRAKIYRLADVNRAIDWTSESSFYHAYLLLKTLGELDDDFIESEESETPQPFDLEHLNLDSRSGKKEAERVMMQDMQGEALTWYTAFADSLVKNFQHYLDEKETKAVCNQMRKMNRSWTNASLWDLSRQECVAQGTLPKELLYPDERFAAIIADDSVDTSSYAGRRALKMMEQQILRG